VILNNQYHIELSKDGDVVVDAGANWGLFSVFVARMYPNSKIFAFEPTPEVFNALKENIKPYPNIKAFNFTLGDENKDYSLVMMAESAGNHIGENGISVQMKTLDSLGIPVNFLKIDTESYEAQILRGAAKTIKTNLPIIAMSAYHHPDDKQILPNVLRSIASYKITLSKRCEEDFICRPKNISTRKLIKSP